MTLREMALELVRHRRDEAIASAELAMYQINGVDTLLPQSRLNWARKARAEAESLIRRDLHSNRYVGLKGGIVFLTPYAVVTRLYAEVEGGRADHIAALLRLAEDTTPEVEAEVARLRAGMNTGLAYRVGKMDEVLVFTGWGLKLLEPHDDAA